MYAVENGLLIFRSVLTFLFSSSGATDPRTLNPALINPIADWFFCCLPASWKTALRCRVGEHYKPDEVSTTANLNVFTVGHFNTPV